jgi:eukaryotic-like serine/threonine-protein kinase
MQRLVDNRYRIVELLGSGGMAEVYLAYDEVLEREVALKILHRRYADDLEFVERFRREARKAASLAHPNIVSVHDLGNYSKPLLQPWRARYNHPDRLKRQ